MEQLAVQVVGRAVVAKVQANDVVTQLEQLLGQGQHVVGFGAAFPTVQHDGRCAMAAFGRGYEALQPNTLAAIQKHRLARGRHRRSPTGNRPAAQRHAREHGLQVRVTQPPWRFEVFAGRPGHSFRW